MPRSGSVFLLTRLTISGDDMTRQELFINCVKLLEDSGTDDPQFDMMCIFQDIMHDKAPLLKPKEEVPADIHERIMQLTERRCGGYPLQYLLGEWEFYGYPFKVGEGVLIPRPDTETLIEHVLDYCREKKLGAPVIADLCSGSGCIAVTLKKEIPEANVTAVEISDEALGYLRENAKLNGADINIIKGNVLSRECRESFDNIDIIVSNPPYLTGEDMRTLQKEVACEPALALFGCSDGLGFYRAVTELWKAALVPEGAIFYEYGMGQHTDVAEILRKNGFADIDLRKDTAGILRTARAVCRPDNSPRYKDSTVSR